MEEFIPKAGRTESERTEMKAALLTVLLVVVACAYAVRHTRSVTENQLMYPPTDDQLARLGKMCRDIFGEDNTECDAFVAPIREKTAAYDEAMKCMWGSDSSGKTLAECKAYVEVYLEV